MECVTKFLLVDASYGDNTPQMFTAMMDPVKWGIEPHDPDWVCVQEGPMNSFYWESWEAICDKAALHNKDENKTFYLHSENGNIFGMTYRVEQNNFDLGEVAYFF